MPENVYQNDEYMILNPVTNHYVLTEKYVNEVLAIDLDARLTDRTTINPQAIKNRFLQLASDHVYNYIHQYTANTSQQDKVIACNSCFRPIIQSAMGEQLVYLLNVGDLTLSVKPEERKAWFSMSARMILEQDVQGFGASVLYIGGI